MSKGLMPWHKSWLVDIEYDRVDLVKEGANSKAHIRLIKSKKGGDEMKFEEIIAKLKPEHAEVIQNVIKEKEESFAELQKQLEEATAEIEKLKEGAAAQNESASDNPEEILKSVKDPAIRSLLETQIAKAKAAEAEVRKVREAQLQAEAIAKAKDVEGLGTETDKLVEVYKKLTDTNESLRDEVFGILKAASEVVKQSKAFDEFGASGAGSETVVTTEQEAWNLIEKAADEIAKSKNITKSKAISEAIAQNPELYDQYLKAQRG